MEKILITGASGFVGSFLVEECLKHNLHVYAGIRKTSSRKYLQNDRIRFFEMDFSNEEELTTNLVKEKFDYIIHNAGATFEKTDEAYYKVNYQYTKTFIQALQKSSPKLKIFTFISSLAAFGPADNTDNQIVTRDTPPHPITVYGRSKLKAESFLIQTKNFPYTIIRPTAVIGPRDTNTLEVFRMLSWGIAPLVGLKDQYLSFIYVKDLATIIYKATISQNNGKAYFVSDGESYKAKTFYKMIGKALKKTIFAVRIPSTVIIGVAWIVEKVAAILGQRVVLSIEKVNELKAQSWNCDITPLKNELGITSFTPLELALKETIDWYQKNKWI